MLFTSYNIATVNINTITNSTKLNALKTFIRTMELDIVFLQEVENEQLILPGFNVIANVDQTRRGTAIALKAQIPFSNVEKSLDGRLVAVRVNNTTLCSVYAPSGTVFRAQREQFFNTTIAFYLRHRTEHTIIAGDFNCVLRQCDASGYNMSPSLQTTVTQLQLHDVWLKLRPRDPGHTHTHYGKFNSIKTRSSLRK
jgi:exonuclease III